MQPILRTVSDNVIDTTRHLVCQICSQSFTSRRRDARHCSPACTQRAYRLRHQSVSKAEPLPQRLPKDYKIYQCPKCEARYLGMQRCEDCGTFCTLVGPGGECPHCGEAVAVADLRLPE